MAKPQDGKFQNLTVDFRTLMSIPLSSRVDMLESKKGRDILGSIDPSLLPDLFPMHYKRDAGFARTLESLTGYRYSAQMTKEGELKLERGELIAREGRGRSASGGGQTAVVKDDSAVAVPGWMKEIRRQTQVDLTVKSDPSNATQQAVDLIKRREGFIPIPKWDVNALRVGYGSDTITREDGSVVKVTAGMRVTREDAERDLLRRIPEFQENGIISQVGRDSWDKLNPATKAALTSLAYNYGSIANLSSLKQAITSGDKNAIANAVESYSSHNRGINYNRRMEEARMIRSSSDVAESASVSPRELPQLPSGIDPKLLEEYGRMTAYQKRNFHTSLEKLGGGNAESGVAKLNNIYRSNPSQTENALMRGDVDEEKSRNVYTGLGINLTGGAERRGYSSSLNRMDPELLGRYHKSIQQLPEEIRSKLKITSAFRDPNSPEIQKMYQDWLNNPDPNKKPMANPAFSKHGRGEALDLVGTSTLSREERQLVERTFRTNGLSAPVSREGFGDSHAHVEKDYNYQGPSAASYIQNIVDQRLAEFGRTQEQKVAGFAYGGEMQTDAKELNAIPLDQPRTDMAVPIDKRDNMAVVDETGKTQFTMNDKEQASLQDGKVEVKTREQNRAEEVEPRSQQLESDNRQREEQQKQVTREMAQGSLSAAVAEDNTISRLNQEMAGATEELFKTPSFRRAMAQRHGMKDQDATGDHFSYGSYGV